MNLIEITDENKYEIVSKFRDFKHKIIHLSPSELDITIPLIKKYIFSINGLKNEFDNKVKEYFKTLDTNLYKEFNKKFIEKLNEQGFRGTEAQLFFQNLKDMSFLRIPEIKMDEESLYAVSGLGVAYFFVQSLIDYTLEDSNSKKETFADCFFPSNFGLIFKHTMDFYIIEIDDFLAFCNKKPNLIKISLLNVLSYFENVVLNNVKKAEETNKILQKKSSSLPKRLKKEHIELMKLRKTLDIHTYKEIAKKMEGKYNANSLKALAKEINDALGSNDIDASIRLYEKEYGEL